MCAIKQIIALHRLISSPVSQDLKSPPAQEVKVSVKHVGNFADGSSRLRSVARLMAGQRKEKRPVINPHAFLSTPSRGIVFALALMFDASRVRFTSFSFHGSLEIGRHVLRQR